MTKERLKLRGKKITPWKMKTKTNSKKTKTKLIAKQQFYQYKNIVIDMKTQWAD